MRYHGFAWFTQTIKAILIKRTPIKLLQRRRTKIAGNMTAGSKALWRHCWNIAGNVIKTRRYWCAQTIGRFTFKRGPDTFMILLVASWNHSQQSSLISAFAVGRRCRFRSSGQLFSKSSIISRFLLIMHIIWVLPTPRSFATERQLFPLSTSFIASTFSFRHNVFHFEAILKT